MSKTARRVLDLLNSTDAELSILLTGDDEMRNMNREFRGVDRPTDVIAFAMREGNFGDLHQEILGDVVISVDTAARQAAARGVKVMDEVGFLLLHGILHLLGYDHEGHEEMRLVMEEKERELSEALGIQGR